MEKHQLPSIEISGKYCFLMYKADLYFTFLKSGGELAEGSKLCYILNSGRVLNRTQGWKPFCVNFSCHLNLREDITYWNLVKGLLTDASTRFEF